MKSFLNSFYGFCLAVASVLLACMPQGVLSATTIDADALNDAFGQVFADGSKSARDLYAQAFESQDFDELFQVETTNLTSYRKALSTISTFTQPFQLQWTPNGTITHSPREIPLQLVKFDLELSSYEVYDTFIGFTHREKLPQSAQEYCKYIVNSLIIPGHARDIELNGAFAGVFAEPTPGTPGAVGTMINGVRHVMNVAIDAGTITPITLGAVPSDKEEFVAYMELFAKGIQNLDRKEEMIVAMSIANETKFKEGMTAVYNMNYSQAEVTKIKHFENLTVKGYSAVGDSDKVWCTPKGNAIKPVNPGGSALVQFEQEDRRLKVFGDHLLGYGWIWHDRVYTNDVDLTIES